MDNSDASDCESDCVCESPADGGLQEDEPLKRSGALTTDEVLQRRAKRMRQLMKLYRSQYWGLVEEMRTKYRRFYLRHGRSGWRDDAEAGAIGRDPMLKPTEDGGDAMGEPEKGNAEILHCAAQGCNSKPLALSVFCFAHILLEPRQRLYKPCSFVMRRGQGEAAPCGKPVLQALVPVLCGQHFHQAQMQANRSLKKVLPGGVKSNPPLHLIISEYVRVIQSKRREYGRRSALAGQSENDGKETVQARIGPLAQSTAAASCADGQSEGVLD